MRGAPKHPSRPPVSPPAVADLEACCAQLAQAISGFVYGGVEFTFLGCHANASLAGKEIKPHRHSYTEIILILAGEARETGPPGGRLTGGTMQVHAPGALHAWRSTGQGVLRVGLWFSAQPPVSAELPDVWPMNPEMLAAMHGLIAETASRTPGRRERLQARLILLLAPALKLFALPEQPSLPKPVKHSPVRNTSGYVERFLADNLREPLKLEDVAAQLNISVPTLTRHFRKATGCSVMERLQALRLRRAAELLRDQELSVKQVAAAVGIPEPSYFCRCFRRAFGCTPLQYNAGQQPRQQ